MTDEQKKRDQEAKKKAEQEAEARRVQQQQFDTINQINNTVLISTIL